MKDLTKKDKVKDDRSEIQQAAAALAFIVKSFFLAAMCFIVALGALTFCLRAGWIIANNLFGG